MRVIKKIIKIWSHSCENQKSYKNKKWWKMIEKWKILKILRHVFCSRWYIVSLWIKTSLIFLLWETLVYTLYFSIFTWIWKIMVNLEGSFTLKNKNRLPFNDKFFYFCVLFALYNIYRFKGNLKIRIYRGLIKYLKKHIYLLCTMYLVQSITTFFQEIFRFLN